MARYTRPSGRLAERGIPRGRYYRPQFGAARFERRDRSELDSGDLPVQCRCRGGLEAPPPKPTHVAGARAAMAHQACVRQRVLAGHTGRREHCLVQAVAQHRRAPSPLQAGGDGGSKRGGSAVDPICSSSIRRGRRSDHPTQEANRSCPVGPVPRKNLQVLHRGRKVPALPWQKNLQLEGARDARRRQCAPSRSLELDRCTPGGGGQAQCAHRSARGGSLASTRLRPFATEAPGDGRTGSGVPYLRAAARRG
mmetsp:Transcript_31708/g.53515  ORF Transcript_31708/g.53515 Transcript_31708/m.53515 type:complete len:252 (-) Transcript_31708:752-1507(-)